MWSHGRRVLPLLANSSLHPLPQRLPTLLRGGLALLTRVRSPVVPPAGTTGPFTSTEKKSRLRLSSSGGGLFDGRPKTQTWVWGAFVFPLAGKGGRIALPSLPRRFLAVNMRRTQGQCPSWMCKSQSLYKSLWSGRFFGLQAKLASKLHHLHGLRSSWRSTPNLSIVTWLVPR
jgi:hypothetical protein